MSLKDDILDIASDGRTSLNVFFMMFIADGYTKEQVDTAFGDLIREGKIRIKEDQGYYWPYKIGD